MYNEELFIGLKEMLETKKLEDLTDFFLALTKSKKVFENNYLADGYEIEDISKYLSTIEDYFENKEQYKMTKTYNPYEVFRPCYDTLFNSQYFFDLLSEKLDEAEYNEGNSFKLLDTINVLLSTSIKANIIDNKQSEDEGMEEADEDIEYEEYDEEYDAENYPEDEDEYDDDEVGEEIENNIFDFMNDLEEKQEMLHNLKMALYEKISQLSVDDFLELDFNKNYEFYEDVICEKIDEMNEEQLYVFIMRATLLNDYLSEQIYEKIKEKEEELDSPLLYNLEAAIYQKNYDINGNKIGYLVETRYDAVSEIEESITNYTRASLEGEDIQVDVPDWSEHDFEKLDKSDKFKVYLEELSKLNNQEFVMYFFANLMYIEGNASNKEYEIIKNRIKELSNYDLETLYAMICNQSYDNMLVTEEIERKKLLKNDDNEDERNENDSNKAENDDNESEKDNNDYLKLKDGDIVKERELMYYKLLSFDYDSFLIVRPIPKLCSTKARREIQKVQYKLLKTISHMEKCDDREIRKIIDQLNKTESIEDYKNVGFNYNEIDEDSDDYKYKDMPEEEKIQNFKLKCKYQLIQYLKNRMLGMTKGQVALINASNANGVFNDLIELRLDNEKFVFYEKSK